MSHLPHRLYFTALSICLLILPSQANAMNAKLGLWEWTISYNIPGFPTAIHRSCISAQDLAPRPPGSERCKITAHNIEADRVDWKMECVTPKNTFIHSGHMNYNDTAAMGESQSSSSDSSISAMVLGSYIGRCK